MRFDASQQMRMGQHMKLAPRMIQSMEILQMPMQQLEERIAQELESNATLEADDGSTEDAQQPLSDAEIDPDNLDGGRDEPRGGDDLDTDAPDDAGTDDTSTDDTTSEDRSSDERELNVDAASGTDDFDRLDDFENDNPDLADNEYTDTRSQSASDFELRERAPLARLEGESDAKGEAMANTASRPESLLTQLAEQWGLVEVEDALRPLGAQIISFIEEDGYLRTPLATIIDRLPAGAEKPTLAQMERALQAVQLMLEPAGIAARDTRECLLLQTDAILAESRAGAASADADRELWKLVRVLIENHLEDLAQNRLPRIAERTGVPIATVKLAVEKMRVLQLAPARQLVVEQAGIIVPDAIVEYDADQDRYIAYLNDSRLPNLRINQEYAKLSRDKAAPTQTKEFLRKNLSNAAWLIDAVEQRRRTILRVIKVVVDAQREYFDYGPQALRPLPMTQVADQLGIHVATVSRAVADKYILTPRGVVPLRGFFTGGTQTESGENVSWDAVKAALKDIIDAEDKSAPLSDDALADALKDRGIEIARRTVAKYRDQLGVPTARLRKQF